MDWKPIIEAAIALLAAIITYFVVPFIKSKTTEAQQQKLEYWIKAAVRYAEQTYKDKEKMGALKKEEVLAFLDKLGLLDESNREMVDKKIEAEVYSLNEK